jgi:hypothetical protein
MSPDRTPRRLTLMRPPVVKRHTRPVSGSCSTVFLLPRPPSGPGSWLHGRMQGQTTRACTPHVWRRCRHRRGDDRGPLGMSPAASTRLRALIPAEAKGGRHGARSPVRARRGGGAATARRRTPRQEARRRRASQHRSGSRDCRPLGAGACLAAALQRDAHRVGGRLPSAAREAGGARAPLPAAWSTVASAHAVARWPRSSTVRARCGAGTGTACPGPGLFTRRARECWPGGCWRRTRTAAAAKAHGRAAWPSGGPEGPSRGPADAWAPVPRRPEATHACPRGQR